MNNVILSNKSLVAGVIIASILLITRDILMIDVGDVVLLGVFTAIMIILPFPSLVSFVFFLIPLTCGIPGYMMLVAFALLIIKGRGWNIRQMMPLVLVFVLEMINELGRTPDTTGVISFLSFVAVFFFLLNLNNKNVDPGQNILLFVVGVTITFGVIYYNMLNQYGIEGILTGMFRSGALGVVDNDIDVMKGHLAANANTIAYYAICATSTAIVSLPYLHYKKWIMISLASICFLGGILTFSRTFILCIALLLFLYFIFQGQSSSGKYMFLGTLAILTMVIILLGDYVLDITDVFSSRAEADDFATGGGRTVIFKLYNKLWSSDIWYIMFGCGAVGYFDLLKAPNAIHCGMQQIWVCLGVIGFLLFVYEFISYFKRFIGRNNLILLIPFIVSFFFDQSVQFLRPYYMLPPILSTFMVCQLHNLK